MLRAASHAAMSALELQHEVSTSSPPRWIMLEGKRPDGLPGADDALPVISPSSPANSAALSFSFPALFTCSARVLK